MLWKVSFFACIMISWLHNLINGWLDLGTVQWNLGSIIFFSGWICAFIAITMMVWLSIRYSRLDWFNYGKKWQRITVGASFSLAVFLVIISMLVS